MTNERETVTNGDIDLSRMSDSDWERFIEMIIAEMQKEE